MAAIIGCDEIVHVANYEGAFSPVRVATLCCGDVVLVELPALAMRPHVSRPPVLGLPVDVVRVAKAVAAVYSEPKPPGASNPALASAASKDVAASADAVVSAAAVSDADADATYYVMLQDGDLAAQGAALVCGAEQDARSLLNATVDAESFRCGAARMQMRKRAPWP
jgi:hypothetical protein